jgi:hypothetical protein
MHEVGNNETFFQISASTNVTDRRSGSRSVSRQNSDGSFKKGGSVSNISESEGYPSDKVTSPFMTSVWDCSRLFVLLKTLI